MKRRADSDAVWTWCVLALSTRVALLVVLGLVTGAREYSDDPALHIDMARRPGLLLAGRTAIYGQYPALLPVVEAATVRPAVALLGRFYGIRVAYIAFECAAIVVLARLLRRAPRGTRRRVLGLLVVSPVMWMTSTVMPQDEVIAVLFVALGLAALSSERPTVAAAILGLGVSASKIFLVLPLAAVILLAAPRSTQRRCALVGGGAALLPYLATAVAAALRGQPLPLVGFAPAASFGINQWVWSPMGSGGERNLSTLLALAGAAIPTLLALRRRRREGVVHWPALFAAQFAITFLLFYHVDPEYLVLVAAPAALTLTRAGPAVLTHAALAVGWVVNLGYGVATTIERGGPPSKLAAVRVWQRLVPLDPATAQRLAIAVLVVGLAALAVRLTRAVVADRIPPWVDGTRTLPPGSTPRP